MRRTKYKPSKPAAILGIVVGIGMLVVGIMAFRDVEELRLFLVLWCTVVVGITALNTWAAFSEKGSLGTFVSDDDDAERDRPKPFL